MSPVVDQEYEQGVGLTSGCQSLSRIHGSDARNRTPEPRRYVVSD